MFYIFRKPKPLKLVNFVFVLLERNDGYKSKSKNIGPLLKKSVEHLALMSVLKHSMKKSMKIAEKVISRIDFHDSDLNVAGAIINLFILNLFVHQRNFDVFEKK